MCAVVLVGPQALTHLSSERSRRRPDRLPGGGLPLAVPRQPQTPTPAPQAHRRKPATPESTAPKKPKKRLQTIDDDEDDEESDKCRLADDPTTDEEAKTARTPPTVVARKKRPKVTSSQMVLALDWQVRCARSTHDLW